MFIKTPSIHIIELLATVGFDFIVLDAEHSLFSVEALDRCILAARSSGIQALVRVDSSCSNLIQSVLDMGAAGVVVPHICNAKDAQQAIAATKYFGGTQGFAASHRAAAYGTFSASEYRKESDESVIVIGQIEDSTAVDCIDKIASVVGFDALFLGRADLAISYGVESTDDIEVEQAVSAVCRSCCAVNRAIGIFLPSVDDVQKHLKEGVSVFFVGSDQSLLQTSAKSLVKKLY
ncbi:MAG: aldolase/citrate lyase family protein [Planktomarina sp.]|nr:aldolase/citrate lyase family protein [Planktomarina sp.]